MPIRDSIDESVKKESAKKERLEESTSHIKDKSLSAPWRAAPALGHAADAVSTLAFRAQGGKEKGAAKIIGKEPSTAATLAFKAGSAIASDVGLRLLAKKSPTLAKIVSAGLTGRLGLTAKKNLDYAKKLKANKDPGGRR